MRKFKAVAVREGNATGIGIVEYRGKGDDAEVTAIHSVYYPVKLSNRDTYINTVEHIRLEAATESFLLRTGKMRSKYTWRLLYPHVEGRQERYTPQAFEEALLLASDAVKRESTITEKLCENLEGEGTHDERTTSRL